MLKVVKSFAKVTTALVFAAGIFAGCADNLNSAEAAVNSERAAATTGDRIYAVVDEVASTNDRVQFKVNNIDIPENTAVQFYIHLNNYGPMPENTTLCVRDGIAETKWGSRAENSSGTFTKFYFDNMTMNDGWYKISGVYSKAKTTSLAITLDSYGFKAGDVIAVKEINIDHRANSDGSLKYATFTKNDWERWYKPNKMSFYLDKNEIGSTGSNPGNTNPVEPPSNDEALLKTSSSISSSYAISGIDFLTAGPASDTAHAVTLSWQAPMPYCKLEYWTDSSSKSSKVVKGELKELPFENKEKFYSYNEEVKGLSSGTTYSYRVGYYKSGSVSFTSTQTFKTATGSGNFKFMVISDLHRGKNSNDYMSNLDATINNIKSVSGDVDFTIFNGDMVDKGFRYAQWKDYNGSTVLKNGMVAFAVGNHEYKPEDSGDKRTTRKFFTTMAAIPQDRTGKIDSDYWFIYNKVLFIVTDSNTYDSYDSDKISASKQGDWIKSVVADNEGKFDFLITVRHIPLYCYHKEKEIYAWAQQDIINAYDAANVDLALTADHHVYNRSNPIYKGKATSTGKTVTSTSKNRGTVYITAPMTQGSSISSFSDLNTEDGTLLAAYETSGDVGGYYVEVKDSKLYMKLIGKNGSVKDQVTISKRNR